MEYGSKKATTIKIIYFRSALSASDCFEIGRTLYSKENFYNAIPWLHEALERINDDNSYQTVINIEVDKANVLDFLAFAAFKAGAYL